jgi:hypothetical protein
MLMPDGQPFAQRMGGMRAPVGHGCETCLSVKGILEEKTAMSATGHPRLISAHADFRHEDYVFARTQSRETAARQWDHRTAPLHAWSQMLYPALGVAAALLAVAEIVH